MIDDSAKLKSRIENFLNYNCELKNFVQNKIHTHIENKYNDYKNNNEIKKKVEEFITQIYDKKKENAIKLYNNTLLKNNEDNGY